MTCTQKQAIWELCRQGLHEAAMQAEHSWDHGGRFDPEAQLPLSRSIADLIDRANWESHEQAAWPRQAALSKRPSPPPFWPPPEPAHRTPVSATAFLRKREAIARDLGVPQGSVICSVGVTGAVAW